MNEADCSLKINIVELTEKKIVGMLNKERSNVWEAGRVADDEDTIPLVPAIPLPQETHETSNLSHDSSDGDVPVISLPDSSIISSDQYPPVEIDVEYNGMSEFVESQMHESTTAGEEVPHRNHKQKCRDWRRQVKYDWKHLKKSLKHEAKVQQQIMKEQHGALKQHWKCQKRALKNASIGCGQAVSQEAQLWRGIAREESRALRDSFQKIQRERMAAVHQTKKEILDLHRSFSDLFRL
jgi:hypothetical protein